MLLNRLRAAALAVAFCAPVALLMLAPHAVAQTAVTTSVPANPAVAIPFGDWIASVLSWARDGIVALVGIAALRYVPAAIRQYLTNQLLEKAIDYAIGAVDGAVKGQTLTLPAASEVMRKAEAYAVANAPALAQWLGDTLRPKLLARLSSLGALPANATTVALGAPLPVPGK